MPPTPTSHTIFDTWNSSSTGHQRAENPYSSSTSWRETRQAKLAIQFASSSGDCAGDGTRTTKPNSGGRIGREEGEWQWLSAAEATRNRLGCRDIRTMMGERKKRASASASASASSSASALDEDDAGKCKKARTERDTLCHASAEPAAEPENKPHVEDKDKDGGGRKILKGTSIYINGSTVPHISDHRLKSLLVLHGAEIAISLSRKTVTHVIIGKPNGGPAGHSGAGGGLAAGKLQREISRAGWRGVKVVGVQW